MKKNNKMFLSEELKNKLLGTTKLNKKSKYISSEEWGGVAAAIYDKSSNDYIYFHSYEDAIKYYGESEGMSEQLIEHLIGGIDAYYYLEHLYNEYKKEGYIFTAGEGENEEEVEFYIEQ